MKKEIYISVDIESTGPIPGKHSMYELGACVVGDPSKTFFRKLNLMTDNYVPKALEACGWTLESLKADLAQNGINPFYAMREFEKWIAEVVPDGRPVFVAFNATYDWSFVNWYFHFFWGTNPFGISGLDIKAYYAGLMNTTWAETSKKRIDPRFLSDKPHTHNALDDAIEQAEIFKKMLNFNNYKAIMMEEAARRLLKKPR